jgi:hypothetical protein
MQGKLLFAGNVIAHRVAVTLQVLREMPSRPAGWHGVLRLCQGHSYDVHRHTHCKLVLDNGRGGDIVVTKTDGDLVTFKGRGTLKKVTS